MQLSASLDDLTSPIYVDEQFLGAGGEGSVYLCKSKETGETLVKKKRTCGDLNSANIALKEAMAMARVSSSGRQVRLVDVFLEPHPADPSCFVLNLVMEYCPGGDLLSLIEREGSSITREQCMSVAVDLLESLKDVHDAGLMHRDVKSENVFLSDQGQCKLGDFGLASLSKSRSDAAGTALYSAPEIFAESSEGRYSQSADVWSLGCVLYELALGETLFSKKLMLSETDTPALLARLREGEDGWLNYRKLLASCLQRDPFSRPNASTLLARLRKPLDAHNTLRLSRLASFRKEKLVRGDIEPLQLYALGVLRKHPLWNASEASDNDVASLVTPLMASAIDDGFSLGVWKEGALGRKLQAALVAIRPRATQLFGQDGPLRQLKNRLTLLYRHVFNPSLRVYAGKQIKFLNALKKHIDDSECPSYFVYFCAASGGDHIKQNLVKDLQSWTNERAVIVFVSEEDDFNLYQALGFHQFDQFENIRCLRWNPTNAKLEAPGTTTATAAAAPAKPSKRVIRTTSVKIVPSSPRGRTSGSARTISNLRSAQAIAMSPPEQDDHTDVPQKPAAPSPRRHTSPSQPHLADQSGAEKQQQTDVVVDSTGSKGPKSPRSFSRAGAEAQSLRVTCTDWSFEEEDSPGNDDNLIY